MIESKLAPSEGDLQIIITPKLGTPAKWNYDPQWIYKKVGALRLELAKKYADKHKLFEQTGTAADYKFCWVTDFPMYEWSEEHKTWDAAHHPFTSPHEDDITSGRLTTDKGAVRALAYDIVLNGTELGSGSIRIHRKDVQAQIFASLGMNEEEQKARFGFFLDALEYGTPPHGGIALGLDRIVMILAGAASAARGHRLPQNRQSNRPHGRRPHPRLGPSTPRPQPSHPPARLKARNPLPGRRALHFAALSHLRNLPCTTRSRRSLPQQQLRPDHLHCLLRAPLHPVPKRIHRRLRDLAP